MGIVINVIIIIGCIFTAYCVYSVVKDHWRKLGERWYKTEPVKETTSWEHERFAPKNVFYPHGDPRCENFETTPLDIKNKTIYSTLVDGGTEIHRKTGIPPEYISKTVGFIADTIPTYGWFAKLALLLGENGGGTSVNDVYHKTTSDIKTNRASFPRADKRFVEIGIRAIKEMVSFYGRGENDESITIDALLKTSKDNVVFVDALYTGNGNALGFRFRGIKSDINTRVSELKEVEQAKQAGVYIIEIPCDLYDEVSSEEMVKERFVDFVKCEMNHGKYFEFISDPHRNITITIL